MKLMERLFGRRLKEFSQTLICCQCCRTPFSETKRHDTPYLWETEDSDLYPGEGMGFTLPLPPTSMPLPYNVPRDANRSCNALCQPCWEKLDADERLTYHHKMLKWWERQGRDSAKVWHEIYPAIRRSVLAGL